MIRAIRLSDNLAIKPLHLFVAFLWILDSAVVSFDSNIGCKATRAISLTISLTSTGYDHHPLPALRVRVTIAHRLRYMSLISSHIRLNRFVSKNSRLPCDFSVYI